MRKDRDTTPVFVPRDLHSRAKQHANDRGESLAAAVERWSVALLDALDRGDRLGRAVPRQSPEPQAKQKQVVMSKVLQRRYRRWAENLSPFDGPRVTAKDLAVLAVVEGMEADRQAGPPKAPPTPISLPRRTKAVHLAADLVDALKPLAEARGVPVSEVTDRVLRTVVDNPRVLDVYYPPEGPALSPEAQAAAARAVELAGGPVEPRPRAPSPRSPRRRRARASQTRTEP